MELITPELHTTLNANWRDRSGKRPPALKLFTPAGAATWLIHSTEPGEPDRLFGLCDLGMGFPELGYVSLAELQELRVPVPIQIGPRVFRYEVTVERDLHFQASHSLSTYALAAEHRSAITENKERLDRAAATLHLAT